MKKYRVTITETVQKTLTCMAESASEAEYIIEKKYNHGDIDISYNPDDFGTEFEAQTTDEEY